MVSDGLGIKQKLQIEKHKKKKKKKKEEEEIKTEEEEAETVWGPQEWFFFLCFLVGPPWGFLLLSLTSFLPLYGSYIYRRNEEEIRAKF
ncbi:hypothetical protein LINPERHAP1_LOCUS8195 [Linum perenne]